MHVPGHGLCGSRRVMRLPEELSCSLSLGGLAAAAAQHGLHGRLPSARHQLHPCTFCLLQKLSDWAAGTQGFYARAFLLAVARCSDARVRMRATAAMCTRALFGAWERKPHQVVTRKCKGSGWEQVKARLACMCGSRQGIVSTYGVGSGTASPKTL
jgi:hypothetical protein